MATDRGVTEEIEFLVALSKLVCREFSCEAIWDHTSRPGRSVLVLSKNGSQLTFFFTPDELGSDGAFRRVAGAMLDRCIGEFGVPRKS